MNFKNQHFKFMILFFLMFVLKIVFSAFVVFIWDPLQCYRYDPKKPLITNDRWQVAGFIKSFDYDQVIIGTSMTQNFSLDYLKKIMGGNPIRLSLSGAEIQEQAIVLKAAIKMGKVKSVIWGIDRGYLLYEKGKIREEFPVEFFDESIKGHLRYLINKRYLDLSIRQIGKYVTGRPLRSIEDTPDKFNFWHDKAVYSREVVLKSYKDTLNTYQEEKRDRLNTIKIKNFKEDVLPIFKNNPNIIFYVFFSPYSLAEKKLAYLNLENFMEEALLRKYLLQELVKLKNVKVYDFETEYGIVGNLDNYKDMNHYSRYVNDYMVYSFKNDKDLVTQSNLEATHQKFLRLPKKDFIIPLGKQDPLSIIYGEK